MTEPKESQPGLDDCIAEVESTIVLSKNKIARLNADLLKLDDQMANLQDGSAKNAVKAKVLHVLKQKKLLLTQVDNLRQWAQNMEQVNYAIQTLKHNHATVVAMKDNVKEMQKKFKSINIDQIKGIEDDLDDMLKHAGEIQDLFLIYHCILYHECNNQLP